MLGALVAAAMVASFFIPWVELPFQTFTPVMIFEQDIPWGDMPWQFYAFLASFGIAGLAAILAMIRQPAGLLMLIAGAIPFGLIAQAVFGARNELEELGLPLPSGGSPEALVENFDLVQDFIGLGLPAYFGAAALLVLIGLVRLVRGT